MRLLAGFLSVAVFVSLQLRAAGPAPSLDGFKELERKLLIHFCKFEYGEKEKADPESVQFKCLPLPFDNVDKAVAYFEGRLKALEAFSAAWDALAGKDALEKDVLALWNQKALLVKNVRKVESARVQKLKDDFEEAVKQVRLLLEKGATKLEELQDLEAKIRRSEKELQDFSGIQFTRTAGQQNRIHLAFQKPKLAVEAEANFVHAVALITLLDSYLTKLSQDAYMQAHYFAALGGGNGKNYREIANVVYLRNLDKHDKEIQLNYSILNFKLQSLKGFVFAVANADLMYVYATATHEVDEAGLRAFPIPADIPQGGDIVLWNLNWLERTGPNLGMPLAEEKLGNLKAAITNFKNLKHASLAPKEFSEGVGIVARGVERTLTAIKGAKGSELREKLLQHNQKEIAGRERIEASEMERLKIKETEGDTLPLAHLMVHGSRLKTNYLKAHVAKDADRKTDLTPFIEFHQDLARRLAKKTVQQGDEKTSAADAIRSLEKMFGEMAKTWQDQSRRAKPARPQFFHDEPKEDKKEPQPPVRIKFDHSAVG